MKRSFRDILMLILFIGIQATFAQRTTEPANKVGSGSFIDYRDGKEYRTVAIGTQTWMAENLSYDASGSICYDKKPANCQKYGRLYDWETAKGYFKVCPSGWHLPSDGEWQTLVDFAGGNTAGKKLKAKSGWYKNGNGTDSFGFSALPGGIGDIANRFNDVGTTGNWWTATEDNASSTYSWSMGYYAADVNRHSYYTADVGRYNFLKFSFFSIRCIQDNYNNEEKSALVGIWGKVNECYKRIIEFLNDGTGSFDGWDIKWKVKNDSLYISRQIASDTITFNYKISDSTLTLKYNENLEEFKRITAKEAATEFGTSSARYAVGPWKALQAAYYAEMNKFGDFKAIAFKPPSHLYFSYEGKIKDGIAYLSIKNNVKIADCQIGNQWNVSMTKDNDIKVQLPKDINCKEIIPCFDSKRLK